MERRAKRLCSGDDCQPGGASTVRGRSSFASTAAATRVLRAIRWLLHCSQTACRSSAAVSSCGGHAASWGAVRKSRMPSCRSARARTLSRTCERPRSNCTTAWSRGRPGAGLARNLILARSTICSARSSARASTTRRSCARSRGGTSMSASCAPLRASDRRRRKRIPIAMNIAMLIATSWWRAAGLPVSPLRLRQAWPGPG